MRKKVLFFAPSLGLMGGAERQVVMLASGLDRARFLPIVWNAGRDGEPAAELRRRGLTVLGIPLSTGAAGIEAAARRLKHFQPDVFHSIAFHHHCAEIEAAKAAGLAPAIVSLVDIRHWDQWGAARPFEKRRAALADLFIAVSGAIARSAIEDQGIDPARVLTIHNGLEPLAPAGPSTLRSELGLDSRHVLVGNVANLRPVKGHEILLRAFAIAGAARPELQLAVAGHDFGLLTSLRRLQSELGLDGRVHWLGGRADVANILGALDLYVHPSHSEGLPYAILEAISAGVPVVATNVGGVSEIPCARLVPPNSPAELAAAISELVADPARGGPSALPERFTARAMVAAHEQLYERLTGQST